LLLLLLLLQLHRQSSLHRQGCLGGKPAEGRAGEGRSEAMTGVV